MLGAAHHGLEDQQIERAWKKVGRVLVSPIIE
jgi:hypothetical protein